MNWFRSIRELPTREPSAGDQFLGSFYSDPDTGQIFRTTQIESPMNKELNITVAPNEKGEIIFLTGKAKDPVADPAGLKISGALTSPYNYYAGRKEVLDEIKTRCHLQVDTDDRSIALHVDDKLKDGSDIITGKLTTSVPLSQWQINTNKRWGHREFINFLRQRKFWFATGETQAALIQSLLNWSVKIERVIQDVQKDNRGNATMSLETRVTDVDLMTQFTLNMPIFTGYPRVPFTVEIGLDTTKATSVDIFLFSDELAQLEIELVDKYITDELAKFESAGFNCSRIFV